MCPVPRPDPRHWYDIHWEDRGRSLCVGGAGNNLGPRRRGRFRAVLRRSDRLGIGEGFGSAAALVVGARVGCPLCLCRRPRVLSDDKRPGMCGPSGLPLGRAVPMRSRSDSPDRREVIWPTKTTLHVWPLRDESRLPGGHGAPVMARSPCVRIEKMCTHLFDNIRIAATT